VEGTGVKKMKPIVTASEASRQWADTKGQREIAKRAWRSWQMTQRVRDEMDRRSKGCQH
jgi:hypothetical protein